MTRSENIELLLRLSESIEQKETAFKLKLYNLLVLKLKIFSIDENKSKYDELLANIIIKGVADGYNINEDFNDFRSRKRIYTNPRFIAMYFIAINTKLKYETISMMFKYPYHSMVNHAIKTVTSLMYSDKKVQSKVIYLAQTLGLNY